MSCERAVEITECQGNRIRARAVATGLCARCEVTGRCRMDWLAPQSRIQGFEIPLDVPISCETGDIVTIAIEESALTRQLITRYGLALCGLIVGLLLGEMLASDEWLSAGFGCVGLCMGWLAGHRIAGDLEVRIKQ